MSLCPNRSSVYFLENQQKMNDPIDLKDIRVFLPKYLHNLSKICDLVNTCITCITKE